MAVPKKRVSRTRKNLRHTNWKKEVIPQALKALSLAKSSRTTRGNFRFAGSSQSSQTDSILNSSQESKPTEGST
jgi:ribosomal protein L32